jgi:acyl carrier protein
MDFLDVFNAAARAAVARGDNAKDATSYDEEPVDLGIDSLDMIMVIAVLTDAYGIPSDLEFNNVDKFTIGTVRDYVNQHKTKNVHTIEEVMEAA